MAAAAAAVKPPVLFTRSQVEAFMVGAEFHTGQILGLSADDRVAQVRQREIGRRAEQFPMINFVYQDNSWFKGAFSSGPVTHIHEAPAAAAPRRSEADRKKEEEDRQRKNALIALGVGLVGLFFFAYKTTVCMVNLKKWEKTVELTGTAHQETSQLHQGVLSPVIDFQNISKMVAAYKQIIEVEYEKTKYYTLASAVALIGSASLAAGGYFRISALMTAGCISLVVGGLIGVVNWAAHLDDTEVKKRCYELLGYTDKHGHPLEGLFKTIRQQLVHLRNDNLIEPPAYVPEPPAYAQQQAPAAYPASGLYRNVEYVEVGDAAFYAQLYPVLPPYNERYAPSAPAYR